MHPLIKIGVTYTGTDEKHSNYVKWLKGDDHSERTEYPNAPEQFNEKRDEFEIAVFEKCIQNNIPMLGVCRGMQLVNCIQGGTLTQDIGTVSNMIHKYDQNDKAHGINIFAGTLLNEITEAERTVTNSAHHQAIKLLGNGLAINCTSDDGFIEGVEWSDKENKPFFIGIQWHPERMFKLQLASSPVSKNIRDRFINEIKKSMDNG